MTRSPRSPRASRPHRTVHPSRSASAPKATSLQALKAITAIPTAAGRETRVVEAIRRWTNQRRGLAMTSDAAGNLRISRTGGVRADRRIAPLFITAHLDHPAFVVREVLSDDQLELEFRGGVHDPYFHQAWIEVFPFAAGGPKPQRARIVSLDAGAKPFKRVTARLLRPARGIHAGDVGRWVFEDDTRAIPHIENGLFHTHACDDLAAVAAALSAFDVIRTLKGCEHVALLFTRAEEVGFIGAIAACKHRSIPKNARLICLENSRSFPHDSPIGAGPIVRVGDKMSVFEPTLTNQISMLMMEHQKANPGFKFQRKLMPGGTCEATTFSTYGYQSTCLCLPLGNYHNMIDIDSVLAGRRPAKIGPEFISVEDYLGLIEMLIVCAMKLDADRSEGGAATLKDRMERLYKDFGFVLGEK